MHSKLIIRSVNRCSSDSCQHAVDRSVPRRRPPTELSRPVHGEFFLLVSRGFHSRPGNVDRIDGTRRRKREIINRGTVRVRSAIRGMM